MNARKVSCLAVLVLLVAGAAGAQPESHGNQPLRILVYGATGEVGQYVVAEALRRGHRVTAVSRHPANIEITNDNLTAVAGDLLDESSIASLIRNQDVVIVSVRGVIGDEKTAEHALQYIAVRNVVAALRAASRDAPRLIDVGGSGSLEVAPGKLLADKLPRIFLPKGLEAEIDGQVLALRFLRTVEDVDWTYATPARKFTNGERTGVFRIGGDAMMRDEHGRSRISRADFAVALIDEAERSKHVRQRFSVAY